MLFFLGCLLSCTAWAQTSSPAVRGQPDSVASAVRGLQEQVRQLREAVAEMRSEAAQYRAETVALREEVRATREQLAASGGSPAQTTFVATQSAPSSAQTTGVTQATAQSGSVEERVSKLEEESQLLSGKVNEQYQTKVESASKYRVRLSGIVLLNLFSNRGMFDNQDFPNLVSQGNRRGSFGATLRQSELGLEVFGPHIAGASTRGDVQFDFSGGFPDTLNGVTTGLMRLRTATLRLDWSRTSIVAGQDNTFFSPLSPTSFASLAVPAFGYAGNLWGWIPQVRVEHRLVFSNDSNLTFQGGILDNLTGEPPFLQSERLPQAGERSNQPAYASRVAWSRRAFGQPMMIGVGGYYSRQDWGFGNHVDGWAGTADWDLPLSHGFSLSGEFYRGLAVGGLGGGIGRSVIFSGPAYAPGTQVKGLDSVGGWSQLKFRPTAKLEFNGAFGIDNPMAEDIRAYPVSQSYLDPKLFENRGAFVNFIYRPHSNLLFSAEYRRLRTFEIDNGSQSADQINLMMGILF